MDEPYEPSFPLAGGTREGSQLRGRVAMMATQSDLHGNAPDDTAVVLLLIDVINDLELYGGEILLAHALPMARQIAALKRRATRVGIPAIYVNDNFGRWQSDFAKLHAHCLHEGSRDSRWPNSCGPSRTITSC